MFLNSANFSCKTQFWQFCIWLENIEAKRCFYSGTVRDRIILNTTNIEQRIQNESFIHSNYLECIH
jgi:hypothetical protein